MSASIGQSGPATRVATLIPGSKIKVPEKVSDSPTPIVAVLPPEDDVLANASTSRKVALMTMFSAAQFVDVFNDRYVGSFAGALQQLTLRTSCVTARCFLRFPTSLVRSFRDSVDH